MELYYANWFNASTSERYDYLYSETELKKFLKPIIDVAKRTRETLVFFNNCHGGSAAKNAITIVEFLNSMSLGD